MAVANRERVKNVGVVVKERWEKAMTHGNNLQKWADEALVYNSLVIAWPELAKLARTERSRGGSSQQELF